MTSFAVRLIAWHKTHGRHDLPWQATHDPYRVWLSEIMLQQTQVATVIPYYQRFLARFPTLSDLAQAAIDEVMPLWSGLGYYARARNLHAAARCIVSDHGGEFPQSPDAIAALPGIGRSTANAIAVFCFGAREPILDGNVKRVLCRYLGIEGYPGETAVEKGLWQHAAKLLPKKDVATYIQAQMDLGATVCTRSNPQCDACPLRKDCVAKTTSRQGELPQARLRRALPERQTTVLILIADNRVLLETRPPVGIWGGLLSLPELPVDSGEHALASLLERQYSCRLRTHKVAPTLVHSFSHFRLHITPWVCQVELSPAAHQPGSHWLDRATVENAALPSPIRKLLQDNFS